MLTVPVLAQAVGGLELGQLRLPKRPGCLTSDELKSPLVGRCPTRSPLVDFLADFGSTLYGFGLGRPFWMASWLASTKPIVAVELEQRILCTLSRKTYATLPA